MSVRVLLDTGPIVAYLNRRDRYHEWVSQQLGRFAAPLFSCEPAIAEACYLLREQPIGIQKLMGFLEQGQIRLPFELQDEAGRVARLMAHYSDLPMSLTDACLVRLSELYTDSLVLTLDSHFRLYRRHGRQVIPTAMPDDR